MKSIFHAIEDDAAGKVKLSSVEVVERLEPYTWFQVVQLNEYILKPVGISWEFAKPILI